MSHCVENLTHCPVCNQDSHPLRYVNGYPSRQCDHCQHIFVSRIIENNETKTLYDYEFYNNYMSGLGYQKSYESILRDDFKKKVKLIKSMLKPGSKILEVGAGPGYFADILEKEGFRVTAVELNKAAIDYAKDHNITFNNFICGDIFQSNSKISGLKYDAVMTWAVIEHVQNPNGYITALREFLKPRGFLYVDTGVTTTTIRLFDTGYTNWLYPPYHLHVFSRKSLGLCLMNSGFNLVKRVHFFNISTSSGYVRFKFWIRHFLVSLVKLGDVIWKNSPGRIAIIELVVGQQTQ